MQCKDRLIVNHPTDPDIWAIGAEWLPALEKAKQTLSAADLPRPPAHYGGYTLNRNVRQCGTVTWMLSYHREKSQRFFQVGKFTTDYLPLIEAAPRQAARPIKTNGKDIFCRDGLHRRVRIDEGGLPMPYLVVKGDHREVEYPSDLYMPNDEL